MRDGRFCHTCRDSPARRTFAWNTTHRRFDGCSIWRSGEKPAGRLCTAVVRKRHTRHGLVRLSHQRRSDRRCSADRSGPGTMPDVLDHLFAHAAKEGAIALTGRLEPRFLQSLSDKHCVFHLRGPWVLVNARRPDSFGGSRPARPFSRASTANGAWGFEGERRDDERHSHSSSWRC